ncbi:TonB-dependent receptor [Piscinibacter sakaiensis]|uniref:TonB-dependent receptor n=1 Tax=Piscinibacter sakaiensis TaxID=1547922 RepID=UPI003726FA08
MSSLSLSRLAAALAASGTCLAAVGQSTPAASATAGTSPSADATRLPMVTVTGNPLRSDELIAPTSVLAGDGLVVGRGATLGDTLSGLPGVSASGFGPNASRPVIRGLDGDRVSVLSNGGSAFDASSLSFDHAVPIDPLVVERLEVLRGPATLAHGGGAVGGVVNAIDNRIPRSPVRGVGGSAELRLFALHADAYGRETDDLRVPRYTPIEDGTPLAPTDRVRNSASRASGGALGASWTFAGGHLGASVDRYDSRYGVVAEPDVTIRMARERAAVSGEWNRSDGPWRSLRVQASRTRYVHDEIEGSGEVGTRFSNRGDEARIDLEHAQLGPVRGVVGAQWEQSDFAALGEEAFVPGTTTRKASAYAVEELRWSLGTLAAGVRVGRERVASAGDASGETPRFGAPSQRRFSPSSVSLSQRVPLGLEGTLGQHERAPTSFELYADGEHAATGAYERGDPSLGLERARHLELAATWRSGEDRLRAGLYTTRFSRFIALEATGAEVEGTPEYAFRAVRARLSGLEIDGRHALPRLGGWTLALNGKFDLVRGTDRDSGEALPRLPPWRASLGLEAASGPWQLRIGADHAARQDRVPATDVPTPSATLVNLALSRRIAWGAADALWFLRLDNAFDTLATNAVTVRTVRELAPLPGRSLRTGIRLAF